MTATCICPNCNGTGKLPHYSHIANGDCFACGGTGELILSERLELKGGRAIQMLEVFTKQGEFWYASHRCTMLNGKAWGRSLWAKDTNSADEARQVWKGLKGNPDARLVMCEVGGPREKVTEHQAEV